MRRSIPLTVDDDVFEKLKEMKGNKSWEAFLVEPLIRETEGIPYRESRVKAEA